MPKAAIGIFQKDRRKKIYITNPYVIQTKLISILYFPVNEMVYKVTDRKTTLRAAPIRSHSAFPPSLELCGEMAKENLARNADLIPRQCPHT